jgi:hypothetical protein
MHGFAVACVAPQVGQNLDPAGMSAPHAVHGTIPAGAGPAVGPPGAATLRPMESIIM